jgi:hypothetical protein
MTRLKRKKQVIRNEWAKEEMARENALGRDLKPLQERDIAPRYQAPVAQRADAVHKAHQAAVDKNNARVKR